MFINTHSWEAMMWGICNYFSITIKELSLLFEKAGEESQKENYFDGDIFNNIINDFIDAKMPSTPINQRVFFQFTPTERNLELIYKGELVSLTDSFREHVPYLRWRLGHNENRIDFCFNGFMLKDLLYKNHYARDLYKTPEFIGVLASFLNRADIVGDYYESSKYYCFEYCVPLEKVLFDDCENLSFEKKQKYLLNRILHRLYDYSVSEPRYMFDHDNPIIRLKDNDTMDSKYFISVEEITPEMLWR